jgi:cytochrome P450
MSQAIAGVVGRLLYRLFLHPLSNYPGPKLAAVSNLPYVSWVMTGNLHSRLRELHDQYGDVIRIRPNSLTYRAPQAWMDIYGHRKHGDLPFRKDPQFFTPAPSGSSHMINANEADHTRQKRLLTHAFSDKSLREQQPLIVSYIDLFISKLQEHADGEKVANIEELLNFLTFDIIGDLAFGEPFGCLQGSEYHPWVETVFKSIKTGAFLRALSVYPILALVMRTMLPKSMIRRRVEHARMTKDKVSRRMQMATTRPDFISYILKHNDEKGMTRREIESNASIIISAGSETTATVLAACVFYLLKNPDCQERLTKEIREAFPTDESISFQETSKFPFLNAVIEESLRLHPPAPAIGPRLVPRGGAIINGQYVPGEVIRLHWP